MMQLSSIMSYPERGEWGDKNYRGNCSGWVIHDLLRNFKPKKFLEIFAGSGTGRDVAVSLRMQNSVHLDLRPEFGGWNALTDDVPEGSDFMFLHPPYHDIIRYSGEMWGEPHPDDLSRCGNYDEFIAKLDKVTAKGYASIRRGGRMAVLIGDIRRNKKYYSIMKDMSWFGDIEASIIKQQHDCFSSHWQYRGKFIPIVHEHLLIFRKNDIWVVPVSFTKRTERDLRKSTLPTWRDLVQSALEECGGEAELNKLYAIIEDTEKAARNPHWKEKIRQTLQLHPEFASRERGRWGVAA